MIDVERLVESLGFEGLDAWSETIGGQLDVALGSSAHGDWPRWQAALASLPELGGGRIDVVDGALVFSPDRVPDPEGKGELRSALMQLRPWRKGPYRIAGVHVDTEWRSDWKWDRLAAEIDDLQGRLVLDVGCGNGYHCWRVAMAGARRVIGIDPTAVFLAQFLALRHFAEQMDPSLAARVDLLPLGIEDVPRQLARFDTVFSMGVLYHRRSPVDHLVELRGALRPGGQLVLETLVVDGDADRVLVPPGRYAKMRNVWFIPSPAAMHVWLRRAGFRDVRTVDVSVTTVDEQRATEWMTFESLADFLDPADSGLTVEGFPAPTRAVVLARA